MSLEKKNWHKIFSEEEINIISCYLRFHSRQDELTNLFNDSNFRNKIITYDDDLFTHGTFFRGISSDSGFIDEIVTRILRDQKTSLWVSWTKSIETASNFASHGKTSGFCVIGRFRGFDVNRFINNYDLSDSTLMNYWDGEGEIIAPYPSVNAFHLLKFERLF